jgi:hypothetical protein
MRTLIGGTVGLAASIAIPATFHGTRFLIILWVIVALGSFAFISLGLRDVRHQKREANPLPDERRPIISNVTSHNQSGGITAGRIGSIRILNAPQEAAVTVSPAEQNQRLGDGYRSRFLVDVTAPYALGSLEVVARGKSIQSVDLHPRTNADEEVVMTVMQNVRRWSGDSEAGMSIGTVSGEMEVVVTTLSPETVTLDWRGEPK